MRGGRSLGEALWWAVHRNDASMVKVLLYQGGADHTIVLPPIMGRKSAGTAEELAESMHHEECAVIIRVCRTHPVQGMIKILLVSQ